MIKHATSLFIISACWLLGIPQLQAQQDTSSRLLRFPDIHQQNVTFVYAGDIYIAPVTGGTATRLTSHEGQELFPKFSPDGEYIAFSAQYSGNRQVYVMRRDGSQLRQLTYYNDVGPMPPRGGYDYRVLDWTPDGSKILVRANRLPWGPRMGRPMLVPIEGGIAEEMAIPEGGAGMFSPDGENIVYTPIDREWRTWKRHKGGRAQDVWTYNLKQNTSKRLTTHPSTDQQPLWVGDEILFVSDRAYTLNLYRHEDGKAPSQLTFHDSFDVLWPSAGPSAVVYQNGGLLYRFDPKTQKAEKLDIQISGERPLRQAQYKPVQKFVESFDISHDGKRALFAARGELFSLPKKQGLTRNISRTPEAREIRASWSPDGKYIAYLSDTTGEYEVYIRSQDGKTSPKQLSQNSNIWLFAPQWSGNSARLAWADKNRVLWTTTLSGKPTKVDQAVYGDITHYRFSNNGRYLSYQKQNENGMAQIWLYDAAQNSTRQLSDGKTPDHAPAFDPKGRYLYFLSERDYSLSFSAYEFDYLHNNATRIYAVPLHDDVVMPNQLVSDEVGDKTESKKKKNKKKTKNKAITLNADKMRNYAVALKAPAGNYKELRAYEGGVLVLAENGQGGHDLKQVEIGEAAKVSTVASNINDYRLAAGEKHLLVKQKDNFAIIKNEAEQKPGDKTLPLSALQMQIDPSVEWVQIYKEAWRTLRDWFYDPNLHGQDWSGIYDKYRPLVDHVAHRGDLDFILGEMAGELNAGHIYVQSGDLPKIKRIEGGLLGAKFVKHSSGYFQVEKIFQGENWHNNFRSPLTEKGSEVKEGEFIIAINNVATNTTSNIYQLLENTAERMISISVASKPDAKNARHLLVKPIKSETNLRYLDWVKGRAAYTEKLSGGRIGYIHLPNTHTAGHRELFKHFIPQMNKEALIIDDRYNGGGFIPVKMIEVLARKPLNHWKMREPEPWTTPFVHHDGPKAMLINGYSSSGGDALPYYFRKLGLGKLIGTRTWGGLIGISGNPDLVDGGAVIAATFRFLDTDGQWAVENEGISPDIEVIDRPELIHAGKDPSIEMAVKELLKALPATPKPGIKAPPAPTKF